MAFQHNRLICRAMIRTSTLDSRSEQCAFVTIICGREGRGCSEGCGLVFCNLELVRYAALQAYHVAMLHAVLVGSADACTGAAVLVVLPCLACVFSSCATQDGAITCRPALRRIQSDSDRRVHPVGTVVGYSPDRGVNGGAPLLRERPASFPRTGSLILPSSTRAAAMRRVARRVSQ